MIPNSRVGIELPGPAWSIARGARARASRKTVGREIWDAFCDPRTRPSERIDMRLTSTRAHRYAEIQGFRSDDCTVPLANSI
jgi:hypothetical protein